MWQRVGEPFRRPSKRYAVLCKCTCGAHGVVQLKGGKRGILISYECIKCKNSHIKHGHARNGRQSKTYAVHHAMMDRCYNPNCKSFLRYGKRGIKVIKEWHTFANFLRDMGGKPEGYSIERIRNNEGYNKENCRWIPMLDQAKNRRDLRLISYHGETLSIAEWARRTGLPRHTITWRLNHGWPSDKILESLDKSRVSESR